MFGITNPLVQALAAGLGLIVFLGVGTALFRAGCALADVNEPGWLKSLGAFALTSVVCVPASGALLYFADRYDTDPSAWYGPMRIAGLVAALLTTWLLSGLLYTFFLAATPKKALLVAGFELILGVLLAALVSAVVLVALAVAQILTRPQVQKTGQASPALTRPAPAVPS
jgi:hypothetical protein